MTIKPIRLFSANYKDAVRLMKSAFPKKEQIPVFLLAIGTLKKSNKFTSFYDEERFAGILYSIENEKYYFILYLAVNQELRSKGYGGMILDYAYEQAGGKNIILNVETLDVNAKNYEQRKRRIAFYQKHGIVETGYGFSSGGVKYSVLSSNVKRFDDKECKKLFGGVSLYPDQTEQEK